MVPIKGEEGTVGPALMVTAFEAVEVQPLNETVNV
jgi:hypothetical protein